MEGPGSPILIMVGWPADHRHLIHFFCEDDMKRSRIYRQIVATSVVMAMANPVLADGGDLVGGLIGGMIGAAIINGQQQQRNTQKVRRAAPAMTAEERARNVEVQTALNHFAFPVGRPDGVLGRRSRAAIGEYQALLAFPPTGDLTEMERQILVTAYQRALIGGPQVTKVVSTSPVGLRGLLLAQRDEMLGMGQGMMAQSDYGGMPPEIAEAVDEIARNSGIEGAQLVQRAGFVQLADMNGDGRSDYLLDTSVTGSGFWCSGQDCAVRVFVSTPDGYRRNDFQLAQPTPASFDCSGAVCRIDEQTQLAAQPMAPAETAPAPEAGTVMAAAPQPEAGAAAPLPSFAAAIAPPVASFAAHCAAVAQATAGHGGMVQTVAAMNDPAQALGEQFCQVAAAAREDGAALMAQVQGFTPEQIAAQCEGFAAALTDKLPMTEANARDSALAEMQTWLASAGMPQDQLVGTARICLSVGYGADDAGMALTSALVLAGTGNMVYAEIVGHHLASGVGIGRNPERALEWFEGAVAAQRAGQMPVFVKDQADRMTLIERAAAAVAGKASAPPLLPLVAPATVPASASTTP